MPIDDQELRAIAFLALRVRRATPGAGPWDEDGLIANLRKIANRNLHLTIEHVLRHAADPNAKSPGVLAGRFTPAAPASERPYPPRRADQCRRCGGRLPACACTLEGRAVEDDDEPTGPAMSAEDARQAIRDALAEAKHKPQEADHVAS